VVVTYFTMSDARTAASYYYIIYNTAGKSEGSSTCSQTRTAIMADTMHDA
jgi:hypothetical protein